NPPAASPKPSTSSSLRLCSPAKGASADSADIPLISTAWSLGCGTAAPFFLLQLPAPDTTASPRYQTGVPAQREVAAGARPFRVVAATVGCSITITIQCDAAATGTGHHAAFFAAQLDEFRMTPCEAFTSHDVDDVEPTVAAGAAALAVFG